VVNRDRRQWYKIRNAATNAKPEVLIYGEIESWFGVDAADFVRDFAAIDAPEILVRINSPGGDMFDGIAIMNALRGHAAKVVVQVDALAASAASIIAMGGDEIVMNDGSQLMLHNAFALCVGTAEDMQKMADTLDRQNNVIAGIYAGRAGGTVDEWLAVMAEETWLNAQETVDAGLADSVIKTPPEAVAEAQRVAASFDRSRFRYTDRQTAPAPKIAARLRTEAKEAKVPTNNNPQPDDERIVDAAIRDGRIHADGRQAWLHRLKSDRKGFTTLIEALAPIPMYAVRRPDATTGYDAEMEAVSAKITGRPPQRPAVRAALDDASSDPDAFVPRHVTDAQLNAYIEADPEYHRVIYAITGGAGGLKKPEDRIRVNAEYEAPWDPKPKLVLNADGTGHYENPAPDPKWLGTQDVPRTQRSDGPST
jgi:ATP-dependent protease ClpP protease subunit